MTDADLTREGPEHEPAPVESPWVEVESRWPMAAAVAIAAGLQFCKPAWLLMSPRWMWPIVWGLLLLALILVNPGHFHFRLRGVRHLTLTLVSLVTIGALASTVLLILDLVHGGTLKISATSLLKAGAIVWFDNIIACSLLYWALDRGGPAARSLRQPSYPSFVFPQMQNPELAPPDWRPGYVDYLYLGFTTSTAFSPTDVLPLTSWAKLLMMLQSSVSLTIMVLVVARAINVLP